MTDGAGEVAAPSPATVDEGFAALSGLVVPQLQEAEHDEYAPHDASETREPVSDAGQGEPPEPEEMTKDAFWMGFKGAFKIASVLPMVGIPELAIAPSEEEHGRIASDAIYDLLREYFPSFFEEEHALFGKLVAAGSFLFLKAMLVYSVIEARKVKALEELRAQRAAQRSDAQPQPRTPQPQPDIATDYTAVEITEWAA